MKKKVLALILMSTLGLCACGNSTATQTTNHVTNSSNEDVVEKGSAAQNNQVNEAAEDETEEETVDFQIVNFGDTITNDFIEMSIESASTSQELNPTDTSGVYSYMSDQDGETYFYILGNIKNVGGDSYSVEDMNIQFTFDDKYNYTGYIAADDGGNDFYGDDVKPLGTVKYYMYVSAPDEIVNSYSTCRVQFAFHENCEYDYKSDFSVYEYCYQIDLSK